MSDHESQNRWRDAQRPLRFFNLDPRVLLPVPLIFVFKNMFVLSLIVLFFAVAIWLKQKNTTLKILFGNMRSRLAGRRRFNMHQRQKTWKIDYDNFQG